MNELVFAIRLVACAVLGWMALEKLAVPRASAGRLWRPAWLNASVVVGTVVVVSAVELGLAILLHLGLFDGWVRASAAALVGALLSVVGLLSARAMGGCGCGGSRTASHTVRTLLARNGALFGVLIATSLVGPSWEALKADASAFGLTCALSPLIGLLLLAAVGGVRRQRHIAVSDSARAVVAADAGWSISPEVSTSAQGLPVP